MFFKDRLAKRVYLTKYMFDVRPSGFRREGKAADAGEKIKMDHRLIAVIPAVRPQSADHIIGSFAGSNYYDLAASEHLVERCSTPIILLQKDARLPPRGSDAMPDYRSNASLNLSGFSPRGGGRTLYPFFNP